MTFFFFFSRQRGVLFRAPQQGQGAVPAESCLIASLAVLAQVRAGIEPLSFVLALLFGDNDSKCAASPAGGPYIRSRSHKAVASIRRSDDDLGYIMAGVCPSSEPAADGRGLVQRAPEPGQTGLEGCSNLNLPHCQEPQRAHLAGGPLAAPAGSLFLIHGAARRPLRWDTRSCSGVR
ncbi:hypothetical protein J3F83DRAFT_602028 [Trichoderma novae-zelandiae]